MTLRRLLQDESGVELIGNVREVSPDPILLSRGCSGCREGPDGMGWLCDHSGAGSCLRGAGARAPWAWGCVSGVEVSQQCCSYMRPHAFPLMGRAPH